MTARLPSFSPNHLRIDFPDAACKDAAAALERHPLVFEAAVTTLHSRILGFIVLASPESTAAKLKSLSTVLQVMFPILHPSVPVIMLSLRNASDNRSIYICRPT